MVTRLAARLYTTWNFESQANVLFHAAYCAGALEMVSVDFWLTSVEGGGCVFANGAFCMLLRLPCCCTTCVSSCAINFLPLSLSGENCPLLKTTLFPDV